MKHVLRLLILAVFVGHFSYAQDYKFGKISKDELTQTHYSKDSIADAAVLYRNVYVSYSYVQGQGFQVITKVHERVKIYTKEGFDYGTISESLYKSGSNNETLSSIKAYTYNWVDGNVEKSKLKGSDVFSEETSKYWSKKKFTMPNVKEGCVIEYSYNIVSPFSYSLDEIDLQYDIPIVKQKIKVSTPEYFVFKTQSKGYLFVEPKHDMATAKINFSSFNRPGGGNGFRSVQQASINRSAVDYRIDISTIEMSDVPALKDEPFVNNIDNYRSAIKYELQYVKFPNSPIDDYTSSWEKVVKTIYVSEDFGNQLDTKRYYKDDLAIVLQGLSTDMEKMNAVFQFVKNRMNWNSIYGFTSDEGVKKAYDLKTGNIADINLMLVAMLRSAGLNADPVLVSTRSNGVPLFPTMRGFNYVVAAVKLGEGNVFLDATNKYSKPNMLPTRTINWAGRIVKDGGTSTSVSLIPSYVSQENAMLMVTISPEGEVAGKARRIGKEYVAYSHRNKYGDIDEETYLEKLEEAYDGLEISEYSVKDKNVVGKPIIESFSFNKEDGVEIIGDKMYLSPLFWHTMSENPFKLENRDYPIDFTYPWQDKYIINVKIPEGYKVESIPKGMNISLEGNAGAFVYKVASNHAGLQIMVDLKMNQAVIPALNYQGLKEFYKAIVEKQAEKVILSKISSNGDSKSATGGR
jgi:uncharacterized protein DUF3857/transglutaminase superfamily protein